MPPLAAHVWWASCRSAQLQPLGGSPQVPLCMVALVCYLRSPPCPGLGSAPRVGWSPTPVGVSFGSTPRLLRVTRGAPLWGSALAGCRLRRTAPADARLPGDGHRTVVEYLGAGQPQLAEASQRSTPPGGTQRRPPAAGAHDEREQQRAVRRSRHEGSTTQRAATASTRATPRSWGTTTQGREPGGSPAQPAQHPQGTGRPGPGEAGSTKRDPRGSAEKVGQDRSTA